jgi:hypothetical protein
MVACCYNSAMLLEFTKRALAHAVSQTLSERRAAHRNARRDAGSTASCAAFRQHSNYKTHNGKFMWKLLSARIAMLFGR